MIVVVHAVQATVQAIYSGETIAAQSLCRQCMQCGPTYRRVRARGKPGRPMPKRSFRVYISPALHALPAQPRRLVYFANIAGRTAARTACTGLFARPLDLFSPLPEGTEEEGRTV